MSERFIARAKDDLQWWGFCCLLFGTPMALCVLVFWLFGRWAGIL